MQNRFAISQLIFANTISGIAQGISMIAIPWYFAMQGDMIRFGVIYSIATIISLVWVPYCGLLVDKYDRKRLFLVLNAICGLAILGISALGFIKGDLSWLWVGLVFVITFFNYNLHYPALYAFAQEITESRHYGRITSILEIVQQCSSILAGAGAALLLEGSQDGIINIFGFYLNVGWSIDAWDIHQIFLLDGATYFVSFLIIFFIRYQPISLRTPEIGNILSRIKTGWKWLKNHPNMMVFGIASYAVFAVVMVVVFYVSANYVNGHLHKGADVFASSEMYFAVGAVLAGIAIRKIFKAFSLPLSVIVMTTVVAILSFCLYFSCSVPIFYAALFLLGLTNAGIRIQRITFLFTNIPNQVYGRTTSVFRIFNVLMRSFFLALFTIPFFQGSNVYITFGILGCFLVLAIIILIWNQNKLETEFADS